MSEYKAQLLAVETKLAKDPDNEDLLSLKADLLELIEMSCDLEEEEETQSVTQVGLNKKDFKNNYAKAHASSSKTDDKFGAVSAPNCLADAASGSSISSDSKRPTSEAELLARKKEKNRKKKAKLRERMKEQLEIAESEKQSWQSFANKKGLKGVTKKSIFASPYSVTGKVGVGTNGIADAPSAAGGATTKRKH